MPECASKHEIYRTRDDTVNTSALTIQLLSGLLGFHSEE